MWEKVGTNLIHSTAVIEDNVEIGEHNIIYPYSVIGIPGFNRGIDKSNGKIKIGNNNKIGAHTSIMCGVSGDTTIGNDNLIMNYVNIGHNVIVGNHNEIGAGTIIAGYAEIGDKNKIKVSVTIRNRKKITNMCVIGMKSNVTSDINEKGLYYGNPCKLIKKL